MLPVGVIRPLGTVEGIQFANLYRYSIGIARIDRMRIERIRMRLVDLASVGKTVLVRVGVIRISVMDEHLILRRESVAVRIGIVHTGRIEMRELERGDIRRQGVESAPEPVVHHADADIGKNGILHPLSILHFPFYICPSLRVALKTTFDETSVSA